MNIHGTPTRCIRPVPGAMAVDIIDQTELPQRYRERRLVTLEEVARAIRTMQVRGAPLIGATAAFGVALAFVVLVVLAIALKAVADYAAMAFSTFLKST